MSDLHGTNKRSINNLFKLKTPPIKRTKCDPNQSTFTFGGTKAKLTLTSKPKPVTTPLNSTSSSQLNRATMSLMGNQRNVFQMPPRSQSSMGKLENSSATDAPSLLSRSRSSLNEFNDIDFDDDFVEAEPVRNMKNSKPIRALIPTRSLPDTASNDQKIKNQNQHVMTLVSYSRNEDQRTRNWPPTRHISVSKNPRKMERTVRRGSYSGESEFNLTDEQQRIINLVVKDGISLFFTGSAGTGKSVILRELVSRLTRKHGAKAVAVTASTGLAGCNIGGMTINKFAGVGIAEKRAEDLVAMLKKKTEIRDQWKRTKVLIIDEISMLDGGFFDKLEYIARSIRSNNLPFGGIQLVLTGDFFQLPPVPNRNGPPSKFCFESDSWSKVVKKIVLLKQVFRQKDPVFADLLNNLRVANVDEHLVSSFKQLERRVDYEDGIPPTELFPTRAEVDSSNRRVLASLKGPEIVYNALDVGPDRKLYLLENTMAAKRLVLKEGANVMMLKNKDDDLVNGSIGTVITFLSKTSFTEYRGTYIVKTQSPLGDTASKEMQILSKCNGRSDVPKEVEEYAVRSVIGPADFLKIAARITMENIEALPVVKFMIRGAYRYECVERDDFKAGSDNDDVMRQQVPLLLSWALSIHKSQGQTLDRVKVDLTKIFEAGQVYTALSRATSRDRLQVVNFQASKIKTHSRVQLFYQELEHRSVTN